VAHISVAREDIELPGPRALVCAALDELDRRYGNDSDRAHLDWSELTGPRGSFVVARVDGHLAGGVGLRSILDPADARGEIKRLWVRPDLRRAGVAGALMAGIEDEARRLNYRQLYLETGIKQPEAIAFYERIGWTHVESFPPGAFTYPSGVRFTRVLSDQTADPTTSR
jgi:GNAT superfamily N-acetyltransferase